MYDPRPVELDYPRLFPTQSHDIINGARDDALVAFWKGIEERPGAVLRLADQFIDSIVRAFGHEACRTMNEGFSRWNSSAVCSAMNEFVEVVARYAYDACEIHNVYNGYTPWRQDDFVNRTNSRMRSSDVMKEHVAERADTALRMTLLSAGPAPISPNHQVKKLSDAPDPIPTLKGWRGGLPVSKHTQEANTAPMPDATPTTSETATQRATVDLDSDRRRAVDLFLEACNLEPHLPCKIIRKHIWKAVGHKRGRQFEHWQAKSDRATATDDREFRKLLLMPPREFVALLRRKAII